MSNNIYLDEVSKQILSEEETKFFIVLARCGDEEAKDKLIKHNLRLVIFIANKFQNILAITRAYEMGDLIGYGTIGLIKAIETFDINRNVKFSTYAGKCIENEILMFWRKNKQKQSVLSLDKKHQNDDDVDLLTKLTDDELIEDVYFKLEMNKEILNAVKQLNDLEKFIIVYRYGLLDVIMSFKEISEKTGFSRAYLARVEKKALKKLKKILIKHDIIRIVNIREELKYYMTLNKEEKTLFLAQEVIEKNTSVEELAKRFQYTIESIQIHLNTNLKKLDEAIYDKVQIILKEHKQNKTQKPPTEFIQEDDYLYFNADLTMTDIIDEIERKSFYLVRKSNLGKIKRT